jgi:hypothetical protein
VLSRYLSLADNRTFRIGRSSDSRASPRPAFSSQSKRQWPNKDWADATFARSQRRGHPGFAPEFPVRRPFHGSGRPPTRRSNSRDSSTKPRAVNQGRKIEGPLHSCPSSSLGTRLLEAPASLAAEPELCGWPVPKPELRNLWKNNRQKNERAACGSRGKPGSRLIGALTRRRLRVAHFPP